MNNSVWPKRLLALDVSRGFAALAVVLWHWQHFAYNGTVLPKNFDRMSQPLYAVLKILYEKGAMGVEYFYLLSGFIFFWLYKSSIEDRTMTFSHFWVQRFSRLYPLHIVTLLIVAGLQMVYVSYYGGPFVYVYNDLYHFFLNLIYASQWGFSKGWSFNGPVWSVSIEILLYLFFFLIVYARKGQTLFCLGVSVAAYLISKEFGRYIFSGMSLFFFGGYIFHVTFLVSTRLQKLRAKIYIVTMLFWALTIINFYVINLSDFILGFGIIGKTLLARFPHYILFPLTVCSLVLIEVDKGARFLKAISWVGDITYSSYLLHFPLQLLFGLAVCKGLLNPDFYLHPVYLGIFFSLLISLSYITFIGFERPAQNMIRDKYRHRIRA